MECRITMQAEYTLREVNPKMMAKILWRALLQNFHSFKVLSQTERHSEDQFDSWIKSLWKDLIKNHTKIETVSTLEMFTKGLPTDRPVFKDLEEEPWSYPIYARAGLSLWLVDGNRERFLFRRRGKKAVPARVLDLHEVATMFLQYLEEVK